MSTACQELETIETEFPREGRIPASSAACTAIYRSLEQTLARGQPVIEVLAVVAALLLPFAALTVAMSLAIEACDATILVASENPRTQVALHRRGMLVAVLSQRLRQVRVAPGEYVLRAMQDGAAVTATAPLTRHLTLAPGEQRWVYVP